MKLSNVPLANFFLRQSAQKKFVTFVTKETYDLPLRHCSPPDLSGIPQFYSPGNLGER
jgi:hypothetical protein